MGQLVLGMGPRAVGAAAQVTWERQEGKCPSPAGGWVSRGARTGGVEPPPISQESQPQVGLGVANGGHLSGLRTR